MDVKQLTGHTLGKYALRERLGVGGMAAVYHGYQRDLDRNVAIKVLSDRLASQPGYTERFTLEAKTVARLEHSHIVPVYDYGTQGDLSYVVMRWLTGGTLSERLEARVIDGKLPSLGETADMLEQLASALDYAHQRGVIHRDVKTGNVMFDDQGDAYLVDFGIVKLAKGNVQLTQEGMIIGTPTYMAPEQWRDDPLTPAVDQYALAIIIYTMVVGRMPFDADTSHALMYQHLHENPPDPHELRPGVPESVGDVLEWALAKDPGERYPTVTDFAEAFKDAVKGHEGAPTGFFTFRLPKREKKQEATPPPPRVEPTVYTPPVAEATLQNMRVVTPEPAKATAEHQAVQPTVKSNPVPAPEYEYVPQPQRTPPAQPSYIPKQAQQNNTATRFGIGALIGIGLLGLILIGAILLAVSFLGGDDDSGDNTDVNNDSQVVATIDPEIDNVPSNTINITEINAFDLTSAITVDNAINMHSLVRWQDGTDPFRSVAFSANNRWYAGGKGQGQIVLWDAQSNTERRRINGHSGIVYALEFDPGSVRLASAGADNLIHIWDVATGSLLITLTGHTGQVRDLAFSPDGSLLASASEDQTIRLWDANTGAPRATLSGHSANVLSVAFSPDGTQLLSGANDNLLMLWDVASATRQAVVRGHSEQIRAVAWSPDGTTFASSSTDNTVRVWDASSRENLRVMDAGSDVFSLAYSPDGQILASGTRDNIIILWSVATGTNLITLTGHSGWVFDLSFDSQGALLISGSGDGNVRVWGLG